MSTAEQMQEITAEELYECYLAGKQVELIDVSTPVEFAARRVSFATNLPIDSPELENAMRERGDCPRRLYVMCGGGVRSVKVCARFPHINLVNVEGGTRNWVASGLPVASTEGVISIERQVRMVAGAISLLGSVLAVTVHPLFVSVPAMLGTGLLVAGLTGSCAMGLLLAKMPWNRTGKRAHRQTAESFSH